MATPIVRATTTLAGSFGSFQKGEIIRNVPRATVRAWIKFGVAVEEGAASGAPDEGQEPEPGAGGEAATDYTALPYRDLQALARKRGIKAFQKAPALVAALVAADKA